MHPNNYNLRKMQHDQDKTSRQCIQHITNVFITKRSTYNTPLLIQPITNLRRNKALLEIRLVFEIVWQLKCLIVAPRAKTEVSKTRKNLITKGGPRTDEANLQLRVSECTSPFCHVVVIAWPSSLPVWNLNSIVQISKWLAKRKVIYNNVTEKGSALWNSELWVGFICPWSSFGS